VVIAIESGCIRWLLIPAADDVEDDDDVSLRVVRSVDEDVAL